VDWRRTRRRRRPILGLNQLLNPRPLLVSGIGPGVAKRNLFLAG